MAHCRTLHGCRFIFMLIMVMLPSIACQAPTCDIKYLMTTTSHYVPEGVIYIHMAIFGATSSNEFTVNIIVLSVEDKAILYKKAPVPFFGNVYKSVIEINQGIPPTTMSLNLTVILQRALQRKAIQSSLCTNSSIIPVSRTSGLRFFFIQTDRPWYTPEQRVKSKIFIISRNLAPPRQIPGNSEGRTIFNVTITDPDNNILYHETINTQISEITDVDFKLPRYAISGTWKIGCIFNSFVEWKTFTVKREVMSRFEVSILRSDTESITQTTQNVNGEVFARYTYGGDASGLLRVTCELGYSSDDNIMFSLKSDLVNATEQKISGKAKFTCDMNGINWKADEIKRGQAFLVVKANVTEIGTGIVESARPLFIKLVPRSWKTEIGGESYFKPSVPYHFTVAMKTVANTFHKLSTETYEVKAIIGIIGDQRTLNNVSCVKTDILTCNATFNEAKIVTLTITMEISGANVSGTKSLKPWYSKNNQYLKLYNPSLGALLLCSGKFNVSFWHSMPLGETTITLHALVYGRSTILDTTKQESLAKTEAGGVLGNISILASETMAPEATLLAYYATGDYSEVVSDAIVLRFQECLPLSVILQSSSDLYAPNDWVNLTVRTHQHSTCLISVVDKGVLLGLKNTFNETSRLFSILQRYESPNDTEFSKMSSEKQYCPVRPRLVPYSNFVDASTSFIKARVTVITNLKINTRKCDYRPGYGDTSRGLSRPFPSNQPDRIALKERTNFNEVFIWKTITASDNGVNVIQEQVPHSITTWVGTAMCIHNTQGFGMSQPIQFGTFQNFFISLSLPYSVIKDETIGFAVKLHNYLPYNLSMCLTIQLNNQLTISSTPVFSEPGSVVTHTFVATLTEIGVAMITVKAKQIETYTFACGAENSTAKDSALEDTIKKQLLVEAPGVQTQNTSSKLVCIMREQETKEFLITLSATSAIPQTVSAHIFASRDCFSLTLANMGERIRRATGCAEQTTSTFVPMIFALHYLDEVKSLDSTVLADARRYISEGINNLYSYWRQTTSDKGAYDYFQGKTGGDVWLTSFIFKSLSFAKKFVSVPEDKQQMMTTFLKGLQKKNGCIIELPRHSYLYGTDTFSQRKLTAFVIIALLEAGENVEKDSVIAEMFKCFDDTNHGTNNTNDFHEKAIVAYAHSLKKDNSSDLITQIDSLLDGSVKVTVDKEPMLYWHAPSTTQKIETSAYALLTLLQQPNYKPEMIVQISRWLVRQSDSRGKYDTTQATSVVSQALSGLSKTPCFGTPMAIEVSASYSNTKRVFTTSCQQRANFSYVNDYLTDTITGDTQFTFRISGKGCSRVTAALRYHEKLALSNPVEQSFAVAIKQRNVGTLLSSLEICVKYKDTRIDMTMIEVQIVTGWGVQQDSLISLQSQVRDIRHYEVIGNYVHLYFEKFTKEEACATLYLICEFESSATKGMVHAYAYYLPEIRTYKEYDHPACKRNES